MEGEYKLTAYEVVIEKRYSEKQQSSLLYLAADARVMVVNDESLDMSMTQRCPSLSDWLSRILRKCHRKA